MNQSSKSIICRAVFAAAVPFLLMITVLFFSERTNAEISDSLIASDPMQFYVQGYNYLEPESKELQQDFEYLYSENPDIVGWLYGMDGQIDYPVMQYDNDYYLHHDFYGNESQDGTLFVDAYNLLFPRDWRLIIYGHHMKSGSMFGRLQAYEDYSYLCSHPLLIFRTIYDETDVYYVPVAGFNASMNEEDPSFFLVEEPWSFYDQEMSSLSEDTEAGTETVSETEFPEDSAAETVPESITEEELLLRIRMRKWWYLNEIQERSLWKAPVDMDEYDEYLMLFTCSYYHDNGRFMLLCRKLRDYETPEMIRSQF